MEEDPQVMADVQRMDAEYEALLAKVNHNKQRQIEQMVQNEIAGLRLKEVGFYEGLMKALLKKTFEQEEMLRLYKPLSEFYPLPPLPSEAMLEHRKTQCTLCTVFGDWTSLFDETKWEAIFKKNLALTNITPFILPLILGGAKMTFGIATAKEGNKYFTLTLVRDDYNKKILRVPEDCSRTTVRCRLPLKMSADIYLVDPTKGTKLQHLTKRELVFEEVGEKQPLGDVTMDKSIVPMIMASFRVSLPATSME